MKKIAVIGAGAWGTALALLLRDKGYEVTLWFYDRAAYKKAQRWGVNPFLPKHKLRGLQLTADLAEALTGRGVIIVANPAQHNRAILTQAKRFIAPAALIINASKGIENHSFALMSEVLAAVLPRQAQRACYLSGPSFADEVAEKKITIVALAGRDRRTARTAQQLLATVYFRPYLTNDVVGVQVGGAVKNVIAVASGIVAGLGMGENSQAALITRGLAEISRFGLALGAQPETFAGAAGLGDLFLTAGSHHSRNYTFGLEVGRGKSPLTLIKKSRAVVEGYWTTKAVWHQAKKLGVELAITNELYKILFQGKNPRRAIKDLMSRDLKEE